MLIRKKPPRPHALGEPLLYNDHPLPVTRRDFIAAGFISGPAMVIGPAWLGSLLKASNANAAATLSPDMQALLAASQCNVPANSAGLPFICFDLAGGANLVGSEVLVGVKGGQSNFLSTAGYGKLGVPGNMVPGANSANIDASLGLLFHADGAIKRGILSKATTPATAAGTNGAVFCAMSQNDTSNNPHNPMYGIAIAGPNKVGAQGKLLTLVGTESSVSGGNSQAPMALIDPSLQPTTINQPQDAVGLVNTGGATADPVAVAVLESQARISGGSTPQSGAGDTTAFTGVLSAPGANPGVTVYPTAAADAAIKNQVRCAYVKTANTAVEFGDPSSLDPTKDPAITGGATPIFTATDFQDNDVQKTATVMKLVIDGYAGAGTITMSGYDYHDGTRASGEMRNFKAGQMIGAVLEYAQRRGSPVMIYVFSDGSLTSTGMPDTSAAGRGKLGWQGDNSSVASTFFLAYKPGGTRPQLRNGVAGQQIGYFSSDGSVVGTSSPVANNVTSLVQAVILNYMGLSGTDNLFTSLFPMQALGSAATLASLTAFAPIV
jgi:hypothetical protein